MDWFVVGFQDEVSYVIDEIGIIVDCVFFVMQIGLVVGYSIDEVVVFQVQCFWDFFVGDFGDFYQEIVGVVNVKWIMEIGGFLVMFGVIFQCFVGGEMLQ